MKAKEERKKIYTNGAIKIASTNPPSGFWHICCDVLNFREHEYPEFMLFEPYNRLGSVWFTEHTSGLKTEAERNVLRVTVLLLCAEMANDSEN